MLPNLNNLPVYDLTGVNERIERFCSRSIKKASKAAGLKLAISMIDLTTLEGKDTPGKVKQLCYKAMHPHDSIKDVPTVAAVCVYPGYVGTAKKGLAGSDIKEACGESHLKVILETGELDTLDNVRKASEIAMHAGANFIKTSTGKIQPAATMQVTYVMLDAIKDFYLKTGKMIGMKPAGGISTAKIALQYLVMLNEVLGEKWMNKNYFRFGASSLVNDLLMQLVKTETGVC